MTEKPPDLPTISAAAFSWWVSHQPYDRNGNPNPRCNPAVMARLRRVATLQEAALEPATLDLHARLSESRGANGRFSLVELEGTCLVAATLAQVREDASHDANGRRWSTARRIGPDPEGRASVSPLRFRRLLAARTPAEALVAFRRLVSLAGRAVPVGDLAESLLDWVDPRRGDERRMRWAFDYHNAGAAAPRHINTASERAEP